MYDFNSTKTYTFRNFYIPPRMMHSLMLYIEEHRQPGSFLSAILKNDLKNTVGYADDENLVNLPAYIVFLYNEAPMPCWGSSEKVESWLTDKREQK